MYKGQLPVSDHPLRLLTHYLSNWRENRVGGVGLNFPHPVSYHPLSIPFSHWLPPHYTSCLNIAQNCEHFPLLAANLAIPAFPHAVDYPLPQSRDASPRVCPFPRHLKYLSANLKKCLFEKWGK